MWRRIFEWTEPLPPKDPKGEDGLVLGVLAVLVITVSLPYLFGFH